MESVARLRAERDGGNGLSFLSSAKVAGATSGYTVPSVRNWHWGFKPKSVQRIHGFGTLTVSSHCKNTEYLHFALSPKGTLCFFFQGSPGAVCISDSAADVGGWDVADIAGETCDC